jgi:hypothetical protein
VAEELRRGPRTLVERQGVERGYLEARLACAELRGYFGYVSNRFRESVRLRIRRE